MTPNEIEQWSSFKRVFDLLFQLVDPQCLLEVGAGIFSTKYFSEKVKEVYSIETHEEWYNKVRQTVIADNLILNHLDSDEKILNYIDSFYTIYDVAFVDGGFSRTLVMQKLLDKKIPIIGMHDFTLEEESKLKTDGYILVENRHRHFNPTGLYLLDTPGLRTLAEQLSKLIDKSPVYSWNP